MATLMSGSRIQPAASVLSSSIKRHVGFNSHLRSNCSLSRFHHSSFSFRRSGPRRSLSVCMSVTPLEACVKASITVPNKLGDCNFFSSFLVFSFLCFWVKWDQVNFLKVCWFSLFPVWNWCVLRNDDNMMECLSLNVRIVEFCMCLTSVGPFRIMWVWRWLKPEKYIISEER